MANIKNRDCVSVHYQIEKSSAEMINKLSNLFNKEFNKPIYKYEVIDFLIYEFKKFTCDFDETQIIYEFLKFKNLDQYGANVNAGEENGAENEI